MPPPYRLAAITCGIFPVSGKALVAPDLDVGGGLVALGAQNDIWDSLLFLAFGAGMWLFTSLIHGILLAYVRHTYGPEPAED